MPAVPSTWLSWGQSAQDESLVRPGSQGPPAAVSPTAAVTRSGDRGAQRPPQRRPPHLSTLPGPRGRRALQQLGPFLLCSILRLRENVIRILC